MVVVQEVTKIPLRNVSHHRSQTHEGGEFAYFLAGPENPLVEPAVRAVLEGGPAQYFPVVFYGPSGTGKTHLAYGLAEAWKRIGNPGPVVLETASDFHRELTDAVEAQALAEFLDRRVRARLWILEDLETLAEKSFSQIQCCRLLDQLRSQGTPHLLTCRCLPESMVGLDSSLQSRLMKGLVVGLALPSVPTRRIFLEQLVQIHRIPCTPEAISFLATRSQGSLAHLRKILMECAYLGSGSPAVHLQKVQTYLEEPQHDFAEKVRKIAELSAQQFSVRLRDLRGPSRKKQVVYARGVAVYLIRQLVKLSFQQIGAFFGNRDHTTILNSYQKIEKLLTEDPAIGHVVETLYEKLHVPGSSPQNTKSPSGRIPTPPSTCCSPRRHPSKNTKPPSPKGSTTQGCGFKLVGFSSENGKNPSSEGLSIKSKKAAPRFSPPPIENPSTEITSEEAEEEKTKEK